LIREIAMHLEETLHIEIDLHDAEVRIARGGTTVASMPWPVDSGEDGSAVRRLNFNFPGSTVLFTTRHGDQIEAELPQLDDLAPIGDRPVVYLDQNHWSAIAKKLHAPEAFQDEDERFATARVAELARQRRIILPLSMGHVGETGQWHNDSLRYRLAMTMLDLSHGWQLRDVLILRRSELKQALTTRLRQPTPTPLQAVTLEPGAIFERVGSYSPSSALPPELAYASAALVEVSVLFDVLLQDSAVPLESVPGWADRLQQITRGIEAVGASTTRRRAASLDAFRADLPHELAAATAELNIDVADVADWLATIAEREVASMPSLGIYRELLHERLCDPGTTWEQNDLVDMMYLSCGAAYADHVVGERRLVSDLRSSLRRLSRPTNVHPKLADLVAALEL
jgi:hypothetical protein